MARQATRVVAIADPTDVELTTLTVDDIPETGLPASSGPVGGSAHPALHPGGDRPSTTVTA